MKKLIATILSLSLFASTASAMTVGEYVRIAKSNDMMAEVVYFSWTSASKMHDYLELRFDMRDVPHVYCVREDLRITPEIITQLVFDYLESEPDQKTKDMTDLGSIIVQTMQWKFPCD